MKFLNSALFVVVAVLIVMGGYRSGSFVKCALAQSDLKRNTEFNWISGKCVVVNKDGSRVYLNQIRGMGDGE